MLHPRLLYAICPLFPVSGTVSDTAPETSDMVPNDENLAEWLVVLVSTSFNGADHTVALGPEPWFWPAFTQVAVNYTPCTRQ